MSELKQTPENDEVLHTVAKEVREQSLTLPATFQQVHLPELPDTRAQEIYERIEASERSFAPNLRLQEYIIGGAHLDDEMEVLEGENGTMLSAEHASAQLRNGARKEPDTGTGSLVRISNEDFGSHGVVMLGRQTGDANYDEEHQLKDHIKSKVARGDISTFGSVHGMEGGKFLPTADKKIEGPFDLMIGIGNTPNVQTRQFAEHLQEVLADMGFKAGINQRFLRLEDDKTPTKRVDGDKVKYVTTSFSGANPNSTRSRAERVGEETGVNLVSLQLELSDSMRIRDLDREARLNSDGSLDMRRIIDGVYAGYWLLGQIVNLSEN